LVNALKESGKTMSLMVYLVFENSASVTTGHDMTLTVADYNGSGNDLSIVVHPGSKLIIMDESAHDTIGDITVAGTETEVYTLIVAGLVAPAS
jgi:hypothetical protein